MVCWGTRETREKILVVSVEREERKSKMYALREIYRWGAPGASCEIPTSIEWAKESIHWPGHSCDRILSLVSRDKIIRRWLQLRNRCFRDA